MYNICVFVPVSHLESVKKAMFQAGGGHIGDYDCCSWQTLGQGQFRPLAGSQPFIGQQNQIEIVDEYRLEMVCEDDCMQAVVDVMKHKHPYETPAFHINLLCDDFK